MSSPLAVVTAVVRTATVPGPKKLYLEGVLLATRLFDYEDLLIDGLAIHAADCIFSVILVVKILRGVYRAIRPGSLP